MTYAIQWLRSLVFICSMYVAMLVVGIIYLPWVIVSPNGAVAGCHAYCRWVRWSATWMIGLRTHIRGTPPTDEVMVAAKHQSFMDVLMIYGAMPRGKFIMKSILKYAPILGQFGLRIGCIPVDRGKRGVAIKKMLADVKAGRAMPGQLIIYPQGTRVAPGVSMKYKQGTGALYQELGQPCVPVSCNVGVFWPKRGIYRKPGDAIIEFHDPISPGLSIPDYMAKIEEVIETGSDALAAEAGSRKATMSDQITDIAALEALYGKPGKASIIKVTDHLTPAYHTWIAASRLCILSTVGPEGTDASPRGDDGPVVHIQDAKTLLLPDWRGNNRMDSLRNIVRDGRVSLMFLVPGSNNVIRINGTATISVAQSDLSQFNDKSRQPRSVVVIKIAEVYSQCARALMRASIWSGEHQSTNLPTIGDMLAEIEDGFDGAAYDTAWAPRAAKTMW